MAGVPQRSVIEILGYRISVLFADLHFHDLRHTFATWLQNLGVPLEVRATLLGYRLRGSGTDQLGGEVMASRYSHGGYGWNQQLRQAVTLLHTALLSAGLSARQSSDEKTSELKVANSRRNEGKVWWSQRDLNAYLSLERADGSEENQQDDSSESSDE